MNWKKGMKWAVAVFAVVVLMSAFVGAVSGEESDAAPTNLKLEADFTSITEGETVTFTFSAEGATKYSLDYGDGTAKYDGSEKSTSHTYKSTNTYTVTLTAYNESVSATKTTSITVTEKQDEVINSVDVTLSVPETGKSALTPQSSPNTRADVSWVPQLTDGKFSGGQTYTATITVTADTGYVFSDSVSAKLNDEEIAHRLSGDKKSFTVTKTFSATETVQLESPTPEISGFSADKTSGTAPLTVSFSFSYNNAKTFELMSGSTVLENKTTSPISHTFRTAGNYSIKLVAKNGDKSTESTNTILISVSAAETTLDAVNINITAPAAGARPATSVTGNHIVSQSVTWSPTVSSTFAAGTQYKATIKVKNATGYKFSTSIRDHVTVNGVSVASSKVSVSGNILTISEYIIGTTSGEISAVSLTVDAPVLGAKPDTSVSEESSANYDVSSITWYKNSVSSSNKINTSDTFAEKTTYIAEIKLTADAGYLFNSSMKKESAKVNTKAASKDPTISTDKKELTLQYTFPATGEAQKPVITLTAEPANPVIKSGLDSVAVKFTYKITGDYDSASLNFGDNSEVSITQSGGTESHTYTSASTFTVTMRAGNENGTTTKTLSLPITKEQFKASFDASLLSGEAPLKVLFTDTSTGTSGKLIQRSWDFDDGTTAAAQTSVTHTFEKEGTYYVRLFISDGVNQHTATKTITVTKKGGDDKVKIDVDYEPFLIIGDVGVPSPFDLIAEFVRLIQAMLNFDNYTIFDEE